MLRFGSVSLMTFFAILAYIAGSLVLLVVSYNFLREIEWDKNVSLLEGILNMNINF